LQAQRRNLAFQSGALGTLADDPAKKVETLVAKGGTGLDQECIVLDGMQSSDGEETEAGRVLRGCCGGGSGPG
jgi:hypothetical protein